MMNTMGYISADSTIAETQFEGDAVYQVFVDEMKYAILRPNGHLYSRWDDKGSLIF